MNVEAIPAGDLSPAMVARWIEILRQTPQLASPFFHPRYVQIAATIRSHVEIGVIQEGPRIVGFFPFERHDGRIARPVGHWMCDYQAVIAPPDCPWTVKDILSGCRLIAWEFDHQLADQQQLAPYVIARPRSPIMDVSQGFDGYLEQRRDADKMRSTLRKFRKLQRENDVRFAWHSQQAEAFQQMLTWKSEQYLRTGASDILKLDWTVGLLERIWQTQTPEFAGVLSTMYVNDQLAAVWFSMRSAGRLHSWFPTYRADLARLSPGACQLLLMVQQAAAHGVDCIDLGKGSEAYKQMFATGNVNLAEGVVDRRLPAVLRRAARNGRRVLRRLWKRV